MKVAQEKKKYFIFMDESGNNTQDRFFVLGILLIPVEEIGVLFNFLEKISSKIDTRSRESMKKRLDDDFTSGRIDSILAQAKSKKSFEMKFKAINEENQDLYIHILHKYFKQLNCRFSAIVFDRQDIHFKLDGISHWERYLHNAAMLIANNIKNIENGEFVIIADQITQPENHSPYENYLSNKIKERLQKQGITDECIFGSIRMESHSSTFLQLVDIFVGAVGYDFLMEDKKRKIKFMKVFREKINIKGKIQSSFTKNKPNYFSVWKYKKK